MKEQQNELLVALRIWDFPGDPKEITEAVGMEPTRAWRVGEPVMPGSKAIRKENGWEVSSGVSRTASFEDHLNALRARLEPHRKRLAAVARQYYCELSVGVYVSCSDESDYPPSLTLDRPMMALLAELGAEADFDIILLP